MTKTFCKNTQYFEIVV